MENCFECDDCGLEGINCYENIGLDEKEGSVYFDLGQPDRCEECFNKWLLTEDAKEYLEEIKN
jgi:hypothetical protein